MTASAQQIFEDSFGPEFRDCAECPVMVMIPAGNFLMGGPESEPESDFMERPQHTVSVPRFAMSTTETTFAEWNACVADDGCSHVPHELGFGGGDHPVMNVSWDDAQEYVAWLSEKSGHEYRLPSESEWEYATRAGTTGRFNTGNCITSDQANFATMPAEGCPEGEYLSKTKPVASYEPNAFGLYDTHGNVWEWVQDCYNVNYSGAPADGSARMSGDCSEAMARGGSWYQRGGFMRSANRASAGRGFREATIGFRVARSVVR